MITVTHVSTIEKDGGAARAAHRLHKGLGRIGMDSTMYVRTKSSRDDTVQEYKPPASTIQRIRSRLVRRWLNLWHRKYGDSRPDGIGAFSRARTAEATQQVTQQRPHAAICNLHWINKFIDPLPFLESTDVPVVWTLHDMNPLTGGCHYNAGCTRYRRSCGKCPQLGSASEGDLSRKIWKRKRAAYQQAIADSRLQIVAPSKWLASKARSSALFGEVPVHVIPYGLDCETFRPRDTEGLRSALSIPTDHRILLFVAQTLSGHRKGFDLLAKALSTLQAENVTLLSIGSSAPDLSVELPHQHLGSLNSDILLSVFYSLADLFVIPSRQDNLPNTVLESMACGTPVIGFNNGGIPDMVRPGETGWLAMEESPDALRDAITRALAGEHQIQRLGEHSRKVAVEEYALSVQAKRYKELYGAILQYVK